MPKPNARGFSLVELLVVIAIIAVLVALALPSLSSARETSRFVICKSNLRQQYLGFYSYTADYRGYGPADINTNSVPGWTVWSQSYSRWMIKLAPYMGYPEGGVAFTFSNAQFPNSPDRHMKVFQCPATWGRTHGGEGHSYGMNMFITTDYNAHLSTQFKTNGPTRITDRFIGNALERVFVASDSWTYTTHPGQFDRTLMDPAAGALLAIYDKSHYVRGAAIGSGRINILQADGRVFDRGKGDPDYFGGNTFTTTYYVGTYAQHPFSIYISYTY